MPPRTGQGGWPKINQAMMAGCLQARHRGHGARGGGRVAGPRNGGSIADGSIHCVGVQSHPSGPWDGCLSIEHDAGVHVMIASARCGSPPTSRCSTSFARRWIGVSFSGPSQPIFRPPPTRAGVRPSFCASALAQSDMPPHARHWSKICAG